MSGPLTILHAAETAQGGIATVIGLVAAESGKGFRHLALTPAGHPLALLPGRRLTFARSGRNPASLLRFARALHRAVKVHRPHILHLHGSFAGAIGRALLPLYGSPRPRIVYCPHGWAFSRDDFKPLRLLYAVLEALLAPLAAAILCVSRHDRTLAQKCLIGSQRLVLIPNGVPAAAAAPGKSPFPPHKRNILFVGRFDRQKGLDILLKAMQALDARHHLTVVGAPVLARQPPPASAQVTFTGWLKPQELHRYYAHCDVLAVPSRWEALSLAAAEAMARAKPVVAARVGALPELVAPGKTGFLFTPGDAAALAALLRRTPSATWRRLGQAGLQRWQGEFTATRMANATHRLYQSLAR
jgi:glycosyltransferase involved in cell wall biosynthesis